MFILVTALILAFTALVLLILQFTAPSFRYAWLIATVGGFFAWISVFVWQAGMPVLLQLPLWQPEALFHQSPFFVADGVAWAFALSLVTLCLAIIVTAVARANFPSPLNWTGILMLGALGIFAVTADNPLTLVLIWSAIDLIELIAQMRIVEEPKLSERVVTAFASRVTGTMILLWANMVNTSNGTALDFLSAPPSAGLYLIAAAALRLGVFPLHLPYGNDASTRRGFGTGLRMISAGSSLILLARVPLGGVDSPITPYLMLVVSLAAMYGSWMWMRSPDDIAGRPFWLIGMSSLAVASALRSNPVGAAAWSCALILSGAVLFLSSSQNKWLERALFVGLWGISALPFSMTATGWLSGANTFWLTFPFLITAQALLMAGFIRHIQRSSIRTTFEDQLIWAKNVYPIGIAIILLTIVSLGFFGWNGVLQIGNWIIGIIAALLTFGLLWLTPRLPILNPVRAHWVRPNNPSWLDSFYQALWDIYRLLRRLSDLLAGALEGESGMMWTLLFLALFISFFLQRAP